VDEAFKRPQRRCSFWFILTPLREGRLWNAWQCLNVLGSKQRFVFGERRESLTWYLTIFAGGALYGSG